jgi:hypothetical protein
MERSVLLDFFLQIIGWLSNAVVDRRNEKLIVETEQLNSSEKRKPVRYGST